MEYGLSFFFFSFSFSFSVRYFNFIIFVLFCSFRDFFSLYFVSQRFLIFFTHPGFVPCVYLSANLKFFPIIPKSCFLILPLYFYFINAVSLLSSIACNMKLFSYIGNFLNTFICLFTTVFHVSIFPFFESSWRAWTISAITIKRIHLPDKRKNSLDRRKNKHRTTVSLRMS